MLSDTTIAVPDRPGNRRTDTFHNVVEQPAVAVAALVPGDDRVLELSGTARLTDDPTLLESMTVQRQVPKLALLIDLATSRLAHSDAVARADLWNPTRHVPAEDLPRASRVWADHVARNRTGGVAARAVRGLINEPTLRLGTEAAYRTGLY